MNVWLAIELGLAKCWRALLVGTVVFALASCAVSHIQRDPVTGEEYVVESGEHMLPGAADAIEGAIGLDVADAVGAASDAVSELDPIEILDKAEEGNWTDIALIGGGALLTAILGYRKRKGLKRLIKRA
jgi:hypothetical protein